MRYSRASCQRLAFGSHAQRQKQLEAYRIILAGEDSPGRQFLVTYIANRPIYPLGGQLGAGRPLGEQTLPRGVVKLEAVTKDVLTQLSQRREYGKSAARNDRQ